MPGLRARDNENVERLLKAFKKQVEKTGVLSDLKKRQYYDEDHALDDLFAKGMVRVNV